MEESEIESQLAERLEEHGQEHALRWLPQLNEAQRRHLMEQLVAIDYERLDEFRELVQVPPTVTSFLGIEPAPVERLPVTDGQTQRDQTIRQLGAQALEADRVAALTVAGGQGTRLRYDHPKGMYPVSPIRGKSLFELFAEQILAARQRYGCGMPWLIMTSYTNDDETRHFFSENDFFGLGEDMVHFFIQQRNPILDAGGRLLRAEPDALLLGPDGHGGTFEALGKSRLLDVLRQGGWDLMTYFQVDNPLVTVADERFIGHHLNKDADFSCKVVPKRDPEEGLGLAVLRGGRPIVIEYVDVPPPVAAERLANGTLRYLFGSIAIHVMDVPFAERLLGRKDSLPWHLAKKQYEIVNEEGQKVLSPKGACHKFERFVFDALAMADECAFVEVQRQTQFAPVKNAEGEDSPASARHFMQLMWIQWLQAAGADVQMPKNLDEPLIEISPLFASTAEQLKERIEPGWKPSFPLVLEP